MLLYLNEVIHTDQSRICYKLPVLLVASHQANLTRPLHYFGCTNSFRMRECNYSAI